jgi:hypothetical protein
MVAIQISLAAIFEKYNAEWAKITVHLTLRRILSINEREVAQQMGVSCGCARRSQGTGNISARRE